jgi:2-polyprenyl-3-methyl-5-hydroxy-6-metoxy-1,4-benzoquinol methylase
MTPPRLVNVLGKLCILIPAFRLRAFYAFVLFPLARAGGELLDIGCGSGRFLSVMRMLGWDVSGIEPDPSSSRVAKNLCDAALFSSLEEAGFPGNFFDIITSNHSLEHVAEPLPMTKECYRILRPGGSIGLCAPNSKSLSHRLFGRYCYHLEPPRHLVM